MKLFTTGDVRAITGLKYSTLDDWITAGLVTPVHGGHGHGNHRRWLLMQVVGMAVAETLRQGERGCAPSYMGRVINAFAAMEESKLLERFEHGATHLMIISGQSVILATPQYDDMVDVQAIYEHVTQTGAALEAERRATGRVRLVSRRGEEKSTRTH